jgi:hypothetical protein
MKLGFSWIRYFEHWGQHTVEDSLDIMREWYSFELPFPHVACVSFNKLRQLRDMMEGVNDFE